MTECPNCDRSLSGNYCSACGQRNVNLERPITELIRELLKETFEVDGRALRTLRTMIVAPGVLTQEFLSGRRRRYTSPLRLYLVISVVFFLFVGWLAQRGLLLDAQQSVDEHAAGQARFMSEMLPRLMFLLLPVFALFLKFAERKRLYFDHLICSIHLHSITYVALAVMLPFENISNISALVMQLVVLSYLLVYMIKTLRVVYQLSWVAAIAKTLIVVFAYLTIMSGVIEAASSLQILSD